jgi:dTDP-4-dehydrorhamnose 3,5-epimerase-like enzyme
MSINHCKLIQLPKISDDRGALSFAETNRHIPFEFKRLFYLYNVPTHQSRGSHAHKAGHQFILCLNGELEIEIDDGQHKKRFHLNKQWEGLHVPPLIWTTLENFSENASCVVLASDFYDEADYYRNYAEFLQAVS